MLGPRRLRQGYSIDELQAGNYSDEDEDEDEEEADLEINGHDDEAEREESGSDEGEDAKMTDLQLEAQVDARNERWVRSHFGESGSKSILCCPACFTPISYHGSANQDGTWGTDRVVNCQVKNIKGLKDRSAVECSECGTNIGVRVDGKYTFRTVIPSTTADQL